MIRFGGGSRIRAATLPSQLIAPNSWVRFLRITTSISGRHGLLSNVEFLCGRRFLGIFRQPMCSSGIGWDNNYFCPLCHRSQETASHLLRDCPWAGLIWSRVASLAGVRSLALATWRRGSTLSDWFKRLSSSATSTSARKGTRSLATLVCWQLWKGRNMRVFFRLPSP